MIAPRCTFTTVHCAHSVLMPGQLGLFLPACCYFGCLKNNLRVMCHKQAYCGLCRVSGISLCPPVLSIPAAGFNTHSWSHLVPSCAATKGYANSGQTHACSVVAGRFVLSHPMVASVVTGAMDAGQLSHLLDFAEEGRLDKDVLHAIDAIHQQYPNPCP